MKRNEENKFTSNPYFKSSEEAIECAIDTLKDYYNLSNLINIEKSESLWKSSIDDDNIDEFFNHDFPFSTFTLCALVGYIRKKGNSYKNYEDTIKRIDICISNLIDTDNIDSFSHKLRNPKGLQFFSTFSELLLAEYFFLKKFSISYEIPFKIILKDNSTKDRNIDLKLFKDGKEFLVEVYNPFFDIGKEYGNVPFFEDDTKNYNKFLDNVRNKLEKKFFFESALGYIGLNNNLLIAINIHYHDGIITSLLSPFNFRKTLISDLNRIIENTGVVKDIIVFEINSYKPLEPITIYKQPIK